VPDDEWREEIHAQLEKALTGLDRGSIAGIVVLVEHVTVSEGFERRELVVRASLGPDPRLSRMALDAVHRLAP